MLLDHVTRILVKLARPSPPSGAYNTAVDGVNTSDRVVGREDHTVH